MILEEGVPSTAQTKYYGLQNIITDSVGPQEYILHDPTRGEGIFITNNNDDSEFTNDSPHWDLTNEQQDEVALDAHYCTQQFYDMMSEQFGWLGLDGNGKALRVNVHIGTNLTNAFWNGETTSFGDGNCTRGPFTTLEIVGHEFTHGMIDYTSDLVYDDESGAINESLADMFGKALELDSRPRQFSWMLGHSILLTPEAAIIRVMDDPNIKNMPALYKGDFWVDGANVHTNSSIGNLWFSMLVDGKQGTNEAGVDFDVPAIGMDKAIQIAFLTNKAYLTESSDYHDFYQNSLLAAEELYGVGAYEVMAVLEAWKAVGLPYSPDGFDLSVEKPYTLTNSCQLNENVQLIIDIANLGTEPYLPSMDGKVVLSNFDLPDYSFSLTDTILPGEIYSVEVNDWLTSDEAMLFTISIDLELDDDNSDNNEDVVYHRFYEYQSSDLSLTVSVGAIECFATEFSPLFIIRNNSCDTLPAGEVLTLSIENADAEVLWSEDYIVSFPVVPFGSHFVVRDLTLAVTPQEMLTYKVHFEDDPDEENNAKEYPAPFLETIDGDYLNEFSNEESLDSTLFYDTRISTPIVEYNNESYYGSTGNTQNIERFINCPNYEDEFISNRLSRGIRSIIRTCVDFENFENPYLSFDVLQFRNDSATVAGNLHSSMLQAAWSGDESGKEIIFGQTEDQLEHYDIALPAYFKGEMEFKFYTELGETSLDPLFFPNDDAVLLDNLQFQTDFTGTTELENGRTIFVSPNPASASLSIRSEELLNAVEIRNVNGQLLKSETVESNAFDLDISGLGNGVYLMRLQNADGSWAVKRIVKMD